MAFENAKPTVTFCDHLNQHATVGIDLGESLIGNFTDKSDNLMQALEDYSEAKVIRRADNFSHTYDRPTESDFNLSAPYRTCDQKAVMTFFRHSTTGYDAGYITLSLPAPKASMLEAVKGQGFRVKQSAGEAIAESLSDIVKVDFVEGWLKSKK